jgi:hypothetical protein
LISDLKEFEKFLKICRKQGVTDVSFQGFSVKFGDMPEKPSVQEESAEDIPTDALTPEQLMFYAVQE